MSGFDEFDYAPIGPSTNDLREEERLKKLASKGKVDRTEEFKLAKQLLREITPEEVNASELQDTIFEDELDYSEKMNAIRKHCDKNNIPYNETNEQGSKSSGKKRKTLKDMPESERNRLMEEILGDKLYKISEIFKKIGDDVTKKGYLSQDPEIQQDCIRGADAFIEYLAPLFHDNFYGDWTDKFDPFTERVKVERDWTEEPEFIRKYRYELDLETGAVNDRHEYTHAYITGPKIVPSIVSVIKIVDNIQFFGALFKNNRQTRYKQQIARDEKRFEDQPQ